MGARRYGQGNLENIKLSIYFSYNILVRTKRTKIIVTRHVVRVQNIPKCLCGRGFAQDAPGPRWETLQCCPRSPSCI